MIQIIRKLYDNIRKLQIPLPFLLQSSISNQRTQNISCHRSCGIAVTASVAEDGTITFTPKGEAEP